jgi:hypothetical protein
MSANVIQWEDAECDMLVMERIRRNQQYYNIVGRSRVEFWRSVARRINRRYRKRYTHTQCSNKWKNLVQCYHVSKLK